MKVLFSVSALVIFLGAGSAMANSTSGAYASAVDRILKGHGEVGDVAQSVSNPDVSYQVTMGGVIKKINSKYGTVETVRPNKPARAGGVERR